MFPGIDFVAARAPGGALGSTRLIFKDVWASGMLQ